MEAGSTRENAPFRPDLRHQAKTERPSYSVKSVQQNAKRFGPCQRLPWTNENAEVVQTDRISPSLKLAEDASTSCS